MDADFIESLGTPQSGELLVAAGAVDTMYYMQTDPRWGSLIYGGEDTIAKYACVFCGFGVGVFCGFGVAVGSGVLFGTSVSFVGTGGPKNTKQTASGTVKAQEGPIYTEPYGEEEGGSKPSSFPGDTLPQGGQEPGGMTGESPDGSGGLVKGDGETGSQNGQGDAAQETGNGAEVTPAQDVTPDIGTPVPTKETDVPKSTLTTSQAHLQKW